MPVLETIASLTAQIHAYNRQIEQLCQEQYPETQGLRAVGGVGPVTALAYVLTLGHPDRFRKSREVAPTLGSCPQAGPIWIAAIPSSASPRPATATCVACSSAVPNTSSDPSVLTAIFDAGASSSLNAEARMPRREQWWRWPASWPSSSIACGSRAMTTTPSTIPIRITDSVAQTDLLVRQPEAVCA